MRKPTLCLDFDGVIHSYASGWKGAHVIPDPPVPGAISYMLAALEHFDVAIYSSRSGNPLGRWAMKRWLAKAIADHWEAGGSDPSLAECECWGDATDIWRRFKWPWFKPAALITIDDRALTFCGDWRDPAYGVEALRTFRPWNKKPLQQCLAIVSGPNGQGRICDFCEATWSSWDDFSCPRRRS